MYSKKALLFTPNSLSKVRPYLSRLHSLHSLFNSISTAAQTTVFQTASNELNRRENGHSIDSGQYPDGVFRGYKKSLDFEPNLSWGSSNWGGNGSAVRGSSSARDGFGGVNSGNNPDGVYRGYQKSVDFEPNLSGGSSNWGGNGSAIRGSGSASAQDGFGEVNSGYFRGDSLNRGEFQESVSWKGGSFNAFGLEDRNGWRRAPIGSQQENLNVAHQSESAQSEVYRASPGIVQAGQNSMDFPRTQNGYYGGNVTHFPTNASGYQVQQNANQYQLQQTANDYQFQPGVKGGQFQQSVNGNQFQPSANGYQAQQNVSGYNPENNWGFQQNPSETAETSETNKYKGTLEELDSLFKEGKVSEAVEVLGLLEKQGIKVDLQRYFELMKACGEVSSLQEAKAVHEHIVRSLGDVKVNVYNQILEMYCECRSMPDAHEVFDKMRERNLTTWDTMIMGLAKNGLGEDAIDLFTQFKESGLRPDGQMFFAVFYACSVVGDIYEGIAHFESMSKVYGITPSMEHYVKAVDMLGSTGYLVETMEFIEKMPVEPSVEVWETMMNLCRVHGNTELGDYCAELVEHLDPSRLTAESKAGLLPVKPSDVAKEKEKKKMAGRILSEPRSRVHEYRAGDKSHPENDRIYALLRGMASQMKEAGYIPETRFVLHDIDQESKEEALLAHSERLAVSYGLFSSPVRFPIRIIKNLRVCVDCHNALKIISKLVGRELIIRDAKRFHHFKDGLCSCRDYW
ncbi:hypothetical protein Sjap_016993 [Stephania japonica]|uniref:DYW domain-containing protein n=1 Tax=Stephania japonica TaxID=461633 RepID=A0AAP0I5F3_9MAGN